MSTDFFAELEKEQLRERTKFMEIAQAEYKKVQEEKAKMLIHYEGKKYLAPPEVAKLIDNLEQAYDKEYSIGGRQDKILEDRFKKQKDNLIAMHIKIEASKDISREKLKEKGYDKEKDL